MFFYCVLVHDKPVQAEGMGWVRDSVSQNRAAYAFSSLVFLTLASSQKSFGG